MSEEEKKEELDEITIDEFETLSAEAPPRGKVDKDSLLEFIGTTAKTCSAIAKKFSVTYSAMHSSLERLCEGKKVVKRYKDGKAYYIKKTA